MFRIPFVLILTGSVHGIGKPHYECGENGRFEYCIDGIPGCIVGCHCHPGYYFDTDTKICEPNAKLVQEYRRLYSNESPTRVPDIVLPAHEMDLEPTPTTISPMDVHVENIAKDSDDLGDWLYNQFFKTIESQVINNTDNTVSEKPPTRRSGHSSQLKKIPKKRSQKKTKNLMSKKNKKKKTDLRRKLLRITEDDSLFDSNSGSSEDSSDDSNSSSGDTSSDTSVEDDKNNKHNDDKEHGHRKILVINKKPKPPLPSFIFLPNLETPFFPPIGLPAPPLPMYPMVPVPPMPVPPMPMFAPFPGTHCSPESTTGTTKASSNDVTTEKKPDDPDNKNTQEPDEKTDATTDAPASQSTDSTDPKKQNENDLVRSGNFHRPGNKNALRKKMLRQLQQQMRTSMAKKKKIKTNLPAIEYIDSPDLDDELSVDVKPRTTADTPQENVDFKYLAQLIHKIDNKTFDTKPNVTINASRPMRRYGGNFVPNYYQPSPINAERGSFDSHRHLESPDESYYTNLGHQIASLIRTIDATGEQRVNIEIERRTTSHPLQDLLSPSFEQTPFIMENSYSPRSYWERSVRSLLNRLQPYEDEYHPRRTHEDNLINLEHRVETFATTIRPLSLNDLENVIVLLDKRYSVFNSPTKNTESTTKTNHDNLNVNLLPHPYDYPKHEPKDNEYRLQTGTSNSFVQKTKNNFVSTKRYLGGVENTQKDLRRIVLHNFKNVPKENLITHPTETKTTHSYNSNPQHKSNSKSVFTLDLKKFTEPSHKHELFSKHKSGHESFYNRTLNKHDIANLQRMVSAKLNQVAHSRNTLPNVPWLVPKLTNIFAHPEMYKSPPKDPFLRQPSNMQFKLALRKNSYLSNSNQFLPYKSMLALPMPVKPTHHKSQPTTYFHHEIQHLDFY